MKSKHIRKILLLVAITILLVGLASAATTNKTSTNKDTKSIKDNTKTIKSTPAITKKASTKAVTNNKTQENNKVKEKSSEKTAQKIEKNKQKNTKTEPVTVGDWTTLTNEIGKVTSDTTIKLGEGSYNTTQQITFDKPGITLTIDGNGKTINGTQKRVFFIEKGSALVLKNITIINAKSLVGGAIYNWGTLNITHSILQDNAATLSTAGAIRNDGTLIITDTTFINNTAPLDGGAIENWGTLNITHSTFTNNTANDNGGAISNGETLIITDSTLTNNQATSGGAINNNLGTINIKNTTLKNNTANSNGGAIFNNRGTININDNSFIENNTSLLHGGAISNWGTLNITHSTFTNNTANSNGGAIFNYKLNIDVNFNVTETVFIQNHAGSAGAICSDNDGITNIIINNTFTGNTADDKETLVINGNKIIERNIYDYTDISFKTINLIVKDNQEIFVTGEDVELNSTLELEHREYYDEDILEKLKKTFYINGEENITTASDSYTLSNLEPGRYNINYMINRKLSNTITFKVVEFFSEITTSESVYDYYDGLKNNVTIKINDESGEKGTLFVSVKEGDEYYDLLSYHNVKDKYNLTTETIADALKTIYTNLDDSYTINITYTNDYVVPSSTEFTLNIIKQRNTSIIYNIINNTEENVQINITVIDAITKTPIPATIQITGAINKNTETGIITDETLKSGDYIITVNYEKTPQYLNSTATINFKVEIDKDKKIEELEQTITQQQLTIKEEQNKVETLNKTVQEQDNNIKQLENNNKELENKVEILTQKTKTKINMGKISTQVGKTINLTATVKTSEGKNVTKGKILFKVNGKYLKDANGNRLRANVLKGLATIKYTVPTSWINGSIKLEAYYYGKGKFNNSNITKTGLIKVQKGSTTITLTPNNKNLKAGQKVTINVKHIDKNTKHGLTSKVAVKVNGKTYKVKVKNGEGKLTYTIPKGMNAKTVKVTASHSSKYYNKATGKTTFKVTKTTPTIKTTKTTYKSKKTTIKGKILDANNKILTKNVKVTVKVDGKTVIKNKIVKKGKINLSFKKSLKKGYHELIITSKATKAFNKGKLTTVLKI